MRVAQTQLRFQWRETRTPERVAGVPTKASIAVGTGLAGAIGMAVPVVLYGWISSAHSALELPMAATSWLFGLTHFAQNGYQWGSIVVGLLLLAAYGIVHGIVYGGISERFAPAETIPEALGVGVAWGFVSLLFFWYVLLPIARGGAPFHAAAASTLFVAPFWVFVVAFGVLGVTTSLTFRALWRSS
jgi:hypothetical protein